MTCIIVEDDDTSRLLLKELVNQSGKFEVLADFRNPIEAFKFLSSNQPDVVFLDVEMPEMNGIELAEHIAPSTKIIVTTSEKEYAIEAFNINAFDFILKPVTFAKLSKCIQKIEDDSTGGHLSKPLFIKSKNGYVRLMKEDILYLQAYGDYVKYFTNNQTFVIRQSFAAALKSVDSDNFVRVHRSYVVNLTSIDRFDHTTLEIGEHSIPVSRSYKTELLSLINRIE